VEKVKGGTYEDDFSNFKFNLFKIMDDGQKIMLLGSHDTVKEGDTIIYNIPMSFTTKDFGSYAKAVCNKAKSEGIDPSTISFRYPF